MTKILAILSSNRNRYNRKSWQFFGSFVNGECGRGRVRALRARDQTLA